MLKSQLRIAIIVGFLVGLVTGALFPTHVFSDARADDAGSAAVVTPATTCPPGMPIVVTPDGATHCGPILTPASLPTDPLAEVGLVEKLYSGGAFVDAGILVVFFLLAYASTHVPVLAKDRYAVIVSAALGGLALLAVPAMQGTTPNASMLATAGIVTLALAIDPKLAAKLAAALAAKGGACCAPPPNLGALDFTLGNGNVGPGFASS